MTSAGEGESQLHVELDRDSDVTREPVKDHASGGAEKGACRC